MSNSIPGQTSISVLILDFSWAYTFTFLTQFNCIKENLFQKNYNYKHHTVALINSVANPSKQGSDLIEEIGTATHQDWWSTTVAAPWEWQCGKNQSPPVTSRIAVALQLMVVYQCNPQISKLYLLLWSTHPLHKKAIL